MREALVVLLFTSLTSGCGRIDFDPLVSADAGDAAVDADDGSADGGLVPQGIRTYVEVFSTDSTTFVPVDDGGLTLPGGTGSSWVVIATGRLRWGDLARVPQVEVRLVIDGIERGRAGNTGLNGSTGPFQLFDVVSPSAAPVDVSIELVTDGDVTGSVEQLRLIAVRARIAPRCESALPTLQSVLEGPILTLDVDPGEYFVLSQLVMEDTGGGDVRHWVIDPAGERWPSARDLTHGRGNLQALVLARRYSLSAAGSFSMSLAVAGGDASRMAHARLCAIPTGAFRGLQLSISGADLATTSSTTLTQIQSLPVARREPGRFLVFQMVAAFTPDVDFRTTAVSFQRDGDVLLDVALDINQGGLSPTYGVADIVDIDASTTFSTHVAEPTMGAEVRSFEANTFVFEL